MITNPVHISSKGQVVLPKSVRLALKTDNIVFEIIDDQVFIKPVQTMAGSLSHYKKSYDNFADIREQAWLESTHDR